MTIPIDIGNSHTGFVRQHGRQAIAALAKMPAPVIQIEMVRQAAVTVDSFVPAANDIKVSITISVGVEKNRIYALAAGIPTEHRGIRSHKLPRIGLYHQAPRLPLRATNKKVIEPVSIDIGDCQFRPPRRLL